MPRNEESYGTVAHLNSSLVAYVLRLIQDGKEVELGWAVLNINIYIFIKNCTRYIGFLAF